MKNYYLTLLVVFSLCLLSISNCQAQYDEQIEESTDDYNDSSDDDYYSDNDSSTETTVELVTTKKTLKTTIPTTEIVFLDLTEKSKPIYKCPAECTCSDGTTFLNCTYRNLTKVPINLPLDAIVINLSFNQIETIDENDFSNYTNIRNIILSNNKIRNIDKNVFQHNHLSDLDLSSNLLTTIHPDTFINLPNLRMLKLKDNPLEIPNNEIFLNLNDLEELSLESCNITDIYETTFDDLKGLIHLNLAHNPFDEYGFNPKAFAPLQSLEQLKLPETSSASIEELCTIIKSIDIIETGIYNVSCYVMSLGSSFIDSTVTMSTITLNPVEKIIPVVPTNETLGITKVKNNTNTTKVPKTDKVKKFNISDTQSTQNISINNNKTLTVNLNENITETVTDPTTAKVPNDPINKILIGIIVIAFAGLLIGIICRKDVCGIKTKLCRKRRQPPNDNVQPHEEVPLNKV